MHLRDGQLLLSPSDVTAFLGCRHSSALSLAVARGEIPSPAASADAELVFAKGRAHEAAHLAGLRADGLDVCEIVLGSADRAPSPGDWERAARETVEAMRAGRDVVYQAVLGSGRWRGVADFLRRVDEASPRLGAHSYEVLDTKLARHAKPAYVLQLCFYSEEVGRIQGAVPREMHVLLGNGERVSFRPGEFAAYARRVEARVAGFLDEPPLTEALPCGACGTCGFLGRCEAWWQEVDHPTRVAGLGVRYLAPLRAAGIVTVAALGAAGAGAPAGLSGEVFARLRRQARLQHERDATGDLSYELLDPPYGFALLPQTSSGDLFFDLEGNPFWDSVEGSLEYLWGVIDAAGRYSAIWAHDRAGERAAFEQFVDLVHARLREDPGMHVYHYASYELSVLRRLAARYGTREEEVDELLRRGVLVDLFKVLRGGLVASVPRYGLKDMEAFLGFERRAEVRDGGASIVEYERWVQTRDPRLLAAIAAYNEEDVIATWLLRDWLLERKQEAGEIPSPQPVPPSVPKPQDADRAALREALLASGDPARALVGQLLDYHDRERKPVWWAFFDRLEKTSEELVEDSDAIGLLASVGRSRADARSQIHVFSYPAQEHKVRLDDQPKDLATGRSAGQIVALDLDACTLELRRGPSLDVVALPNALIPGAPYDTREQEAALARLGRSLLANDRRYPALESVLSREPFAAPVQTSDLEAMKRLARSLNGRQLVIQGPPGSGKTWTAGRLIADLLAAHRTVGVASTSHKAIHNLLGEIETAARELGITFDGRKKASERNPESEYAGPTITNVWNATDTAGADLAAGTAWLFSHAAHDRTLDYLFIDEAGQVSLADALAMGTCARNLVLIGDPLQLAHVCQGTHPDGAEASVLTHLLGKHATIPPDRGLFLERSFRLHPDICAYISEVFYENRLRPDPRTAARTTPLGTGLRYIPVEHQGNRQSSEQEADAGAAEIARLRAAGVPESAVMVVAPFNAHVDLLRERLPAAVRVGTVDKFQGQEAPVVIYSMASSSGEDVPRGLDFLLSRNRLNVAISRAQCLAYLVCSPRLLEVDAKTIEHMRLANALCRFVEIADQQAEAAAGRPASARS
jgi:predicted RecB family nuclease